MHHFKTRYLTAALAAIVALTVVAYGAEYNFYEQADKKGCASVITERGQDECTRVQRQKDNACNVQLDCDLDRFERLLSKYKEAKDRLDRGQVADADKDKLRETVRSIKEQLDDSKMNARKSASVAQGCVDARHGVQKWFTETAIPLTERTRDDALRLRKELLEKLAEAQRKQADAKSQRDAKPGDSSAQSDYDRATEDMRSAEKALEHFNGKYGKDIERYAEKLISHYKDEKETHDRPLTEAKNRVENCKKIDNLSY